MGEGHSRFLAESLEMDRAPPGRLQPARIAAPIVLQGLSTAVHRQVAPNCFAYATATAVRGYIAAHYGKQYCPDHSTLLAMLTGKFGTCGTDTLMACEWLCGELRDEFDIGCYEASQAQVEKVFSKRSNQVAIARFRLSEEGFRALRLFFSECPTDVLRGPVEEGDIGHAVVISGMADRYWKVKNSWGWDRGDQGHFRVAKNAFPFRFVLVGGLSDGSDVDD